jgi:hypothetical protein
MPSTSAKQHRFMEAIAHSPGFAKKAGVPQSVGKDFAAADDKAGITKTHGGRAVGSPKSREEHMARATKHQTQTATAKDFGTSQSTISRKVMRSGYVGGGPAK